MALPITTAILGLVCGLSIVTLLSHVAEVPTVAPTLATMIGLGVGIDYALFVVTRYRSGLRDGLEVREAVITAIDTAGRAVFFAGTTVIVALLGMLLLGVTFLRGPAVASALAVLFTMIASLTLLPALLGMIGRRIDRWRFPLGKGATGGGPGWARWARFVQRRPWPLALGATALLLTPGRTRRARPRARPTTSSPRASGPGSTARSRSWPRSRARVTGRPRSSCATPWPPSTASQASRRPS
jgi:RND superfamily putative drug exporter